MSLILDSALGRTVYVQDTRDAGFAEPAQQAAAPPASEPPVTDPALLAAMDPNSLPAPDPAAQMNSSGYFESSLGSIVDDII